MAEENGRALEHWSNMARTQNREPREGVRGTRSRGRRGADVEAGEGGVAALAAGLESLEFVGGLEILAVEVRLPSTPLRTGVALVSDMYLTLIIPLPSGLLPIPRR